MPKFHEHDEKNAKNLSEKTIETMNDHEMIKKLYDECQLKSRTTEDFFDELKMSNGVNIRGKTISELRRSDFVPRQRCQTLSTEAHKENRKQQKESIL